jgi:hypothetical protein
MDTIKEVRVEVDEEKDQFPKCLLQLASPTRYYSPAREREATRICVTNHASGGYLSECALLFYTTRAREGSTKSTIVDVQG